MFVTLMSQMRCDVLTNFEKMTKNYWTSKNANI